MPFISGNSLHEGIQNFEPHINRLILQKVKEAEESEPSYDCQSYLNRYPELKKEFGESCENLQTRMRAIGHWIQFGKKEKRNPTSIDKLNDVQKEEILRKRNEQLQIELLNSIAKLQSKHDEEHKNKKDQDYRLEEKKKLCRTRMAKAASGLRVAENKIERAKIQGNRTRRICETTPVNNNYNKKSEPTNKTVEIKKDLYTYVGEGGCHNDIGKAEQDCRVDPNCNFIGQQSNGCWHKLKQDNNGVSKKSSYPRGFYKVI